MADNLDTKIVGSHRASMAEEREHELPMLSKRTMPIASNQQILYDYDGFGRLLYEGHGAKGLETDEEGWLLVNYLYNESSDVIYRRTAYGKWTDRVSATYTPSVSGGYSGASVADDKLENIENILIGVLKELKKITLHMSLVTDLQVKNADVEV